MKRQLMRPFALLPAAAIGAAHRREVCLAPPSSPAPGPMRGAQPDAPHAFSLLAAAGAAVLAPRVPAHATAAAAAAAHRLRA